MEEIGLSVLIVDDSSIIYRRLKLLLKELELVTSITYAGNYSAAVQVIGKGDIDIVLMDVFLPDKKGADLLRFVKKENPSIKVIVITNHVDDHYRKLCKELGADHFIDKSKDFSLIPGLLTG
jgi:DNA-binding NarL/FixJ family response regulator